MKRIFATMNLFFFAQESIEGTDGYLYYLIAGVSLVIGLLLNGYVMVEKLS